MNITQIIKDFETQQKCILHLEKVRWNNKPTCPYCKSERSSKYKSTRYYTCLNCNDSYSVTVGTLFHDTKVPLQKWFMAISLILNAKKGISALQLKRDLGIGSYKTAWRMLRLIRKAMVNKQEQQYFYSIVEIDETYIGGKPRKFSKDNKRGRGTKKVPVIGVVNRETKEVYAKIAEPNAEGKKLTGKQLLAVLKEASNEYMTTVMSDEFRSYNILKSTEYKHFVVDHTKEFVSGNIHTNTIESFWALLKRGLYGIYHHVSQKYLQEYVNEFCFRYNNRNEQQAFDVILNKAMLGIA